MKILNWSGKIILHFHFTNCWGGESVLFIIVASSERGRGGNVCFSPGGNSSSLLLFSFKTAHPIMLLVSVLNELFLIVASCGGLTPGGTKKWGYYSGYIFLCTTSSFIGIMDGIQDENQTLNYVLKKSKVHLKNIEPNMFNVSWITSLQFSARYVL